MASKVQQTIPFDDPLLVAKIETAAALTHVLSALPHLLRIQSNLSATSRTLRHSQDFRTLNYSIDSLVRARNAIREALANLPLEVPHE